MLIKIEQGELTEHREYIPQRNKNGYSEYSITKGKGFYKDFIFKRMHIGYAHFLFERKTKISFKNEDEVLKMHFVLDGKTLMNSSIPIETHSFKSYHHNLIYSPKTNWEWFADNELQLFEVTIEIAFFKKYVSKKDPNISSFIDAIEKKIPSCLSNKNWVTTPEMLSIIKEITNCERENNYKEMFIEAKIIQLLLLQLEQLCISNNPLKGKIKNSDTAKMYEARDIILSNLKNPFSLKELAYQIGTNEFTLKKSFRAVFDTTVFGFLNDVKMEKAQTLLTEHKLSITQVAELVGYKNATHFTTAFKKKFGILPSSLKK